MKKNSPAYKILVALYLLIPFKKLIFSLIKYLKIPNDNFYNYLRFIGTFKVKIDDRHFFIKHHFYTRIENELFWKGFANSWDRVSLALWKELSKKSDVIFDVGANTGVYSLVAKTVNSSAEVFAFEPSERVYQKLMNNIKLNNYNITAEQTALSDKNGEQMFYDVKHQHQYGASLSTQRRDNFEKSKREIVKAKVAVQTLQNYMDANQIERIDLLKIDVELHEYEVLKGSASIIKKYEPAILIEILTDEMAHKIEPFFTENDYLFYQIDEVNNPRLMPGLVKSEHRNFLICNPKTAADLKLKTAATNGVK